MNLKSSLWPIRFCLNDKDEMSDVSHKSAGVYRKVPLSKKFCRNLEAVNEKRWFCSATRKKKKRFKYSARQCKDHRDPSCTISTEHVLLICLQYFTSANKNIKPILYVQESPLLTVPKEFTQKLQRNHWNTRNNSQKDRKFRKTWKNEQFKLLLKGLEMKPVNVLNCS